MSALCGQKGVVRGVIGDIYSCDQRGVELGTELAERVLPEIEAGDEPELSHDSSTNALVRRFRKMRG